MAGQMASAAALAEAAAPRLAARESPSVVDLNADVGEGFDDAGLLEYVTSVNVACGGHVGDRGTVAATVDLAASAGAAVGAHVAYEDRERFGRAAMPGVDPAALRDAVLFQAGALDAVCRARGTRVTYVKPHGALYHAVMAGGPHADAVFEAADTLDLPLLLMPASPYAAFGEGFAERAYDGDALRPRGKAGAVIHDPDLAAKQAVDLAARPDLHTICVHGDSPNAVAVARAVRGALERAGFRLAPFCPS